MLSKKLAVCRHPSKVRCACQTADCDMAALVLAHLSCSCSMHRGSMQTLVLDVFVSQTVPHSCLLLGHQGDIKRAFLLHDCCLALPALTSRPGLLGFLGFLELRGSYQHNRCSEQLASTSVRLMELPAYCILHTLWRQL